jgi:uncharacterized protein
MNDFSQRYGNWGLIAGAAAGIGAAFAEILAGLGMNLLLVDKEYDQMKQLADRLESKFAINTRLLHQDLADKNAAQHCMDLIAPYDCRLLIYVPAYSPVQPFLQNETTDLDLFVDLNCRTPLHLVHAFVEKIKEGSPVGIILISSLAGLVGPKFSAIYAGTKAFAILLTEAMDAEFRDQPLDITVCCAGITDTPTYWSSRPDRTKVAPGMMQPVEVASYALKMLGKKVICIPGWKNRLSYFFLLKLIPRGVAARIVSAAMSKMYPDRNRVS